MSEATLAMLMTLLPTMTNEYHGTLIAYLLQFHRVAEAVLRGCCPAVTWMTTRFARRDDESLHKSPVTCDTHLGMPQLLKCSFFLSF
jgi:hypothetical protein